MLDPGRDDVPAVARIGQRDAAQSQVDAFRRAGGEDDVLRGAAKLGGDVLVAQGGFLSYDLDPSRLRFAPVLWPRLSPADRDRLRGSAGEAVERYFSRLSFGSD